MPNVFFVVDLPHATGITFSDLVDVQAFKDQAVIVMPNICEVALRRTDSVIARENDTWKKQNRHKVIVSKKRFEREGDFIASFLAELHAGDIVLILNSSLTQDFIVEQYKQRCRDKKGIHVDVFSLIRPLPKYDFEISGQGNLTLYRLCKKPYEALEKTFRTRYRSAGESYVYPITIRRTVFSKTYSGWVEL